MFPFLGHWVQRGRDAGVGMEPVKSRKPLWRWLNPGSPSGGKPWTTPSRRREAPLSGSDGPPESAAPTFVLMTQNPPIVCGLVFSNCIKTCSWLGCKFYFLSGWRVSDSRVCWLPAQRGCQGLTAERRNFKRRMLSEAWSASGSVSSCWILLQSDGLRGWWWALGGARLCFPQVQHHGKHKATGF